MLRHEIINNKIIIILIIRREIINNLNLVARSRVEYSNFFVFTRHDNPTSVPIPGSTQRDVVRSNLTYDLTSAHIPYKHLVIGACI